MKKLAARLNSVCNARGNNDSPTGRGEKGVRPWRFLRLERFLLGIAATYYLMAVPVLALLRDRLPVEYDWIEGCMLAQVRRFLEGNSLYTPPALDYVPLLYAPLYTYVSAWPVSLMGESYTVLRYVSLAATIGTEALIAMLVWRESGSRLAALVAAGLYAGMYGVVGFSFDQARVDALFVFFVMAMAYSIRIATEKGGIACACAALAAACAVLTKQNALAPVMFLCLWSLFMPGAKGRMTALFSLGTVFISQIIPALTGHEWYYYYLYEMPSSHPLLSGNISKFMTHELLPRLSIGLALSLGVLIFIARKSRDKRKAIFFWAFFAGMALAALASRFKNGGNVNNLMPLAAALAVMCGMGLGLLRLERGWRPAIVFFLLLCFNLQIFYSPKRALPTANARARTQKELAMFRGFKGEVFAPFHPYLPLLAQKNGSAYWGGIVDVLQCPGPAKDILQDKLRRALEGQRFQAVVLRNGFFMEDRFPYRLLDRYYRKLSPAEIMADGGASVQSLSVYIPLTKADITMNDE